VIPITIGGCFGEFVLRSGLNTHKSGSVIKPQRFDRLLTERHQFKTFNGAFNSRRSPNRDFKALRSSLKKKVAFLTYSFLIGNWVTCKGF